VGAPAGLGTPFSGEAARYARQLAARHDRHPDAEQALAEPPPVVLSAVPGFVNDDDERGEACGDPGDDDFYADAFEVLE